MLTASSVVNSNLSCSSRISSCSDFTSGHSWRPIETVKLHRKHAARSLRISCTATKPAKSPAEEDWKIKRQVLVEKRVRSVDVKEALRLQKENNFVILDVRPEAEFKEAHPPGAINVQIYRLIKEWTAWDIARRAAFAFFGIFAGTEENPEFIQNVDAKVGKDAKIIVACSTGGTLKPTQNFPDGKQSRYTSLHKSASQFPSFTCSSNLALSMIIKHWTIAKLSLFRKPILEMDLFECSSLSFVGSDIRNCWEKLVIIDPCNFLVLSEMHITIYSGSKISTEIG